MPIWVALWTTLQNTFELRQAPFLWGLTWIKDLSQADRIIPFTASIPLVFTTIDAINLLPVLLAVVFYLQQKFTPKPPATTPEQEQQQKMMQWMSLLFPVFLYKMPSGLNLYILTSTTIGIIESKRIRDHIKQREEMEKKDKVIVETRATRASKRLPKDKDQETKSGLAGWIAGLADRADQIRRDADKRK
jgi:YidC/Oxa1 family membrane protein insertase